MPCAVSPAQGIGWVNPERAVRSITVDTESTDANVDERTNTPQPWQSWDTTVRCLILRLAQAAPSALLVWQAYARR